MPSNEGNGSMSVRTDDDFDLQTSVQDELAWIPDVDSAGIGVAVMDGTVTLSGEIENYSERVAAVHAALRVRGVRALVDDLSVHSKSPWPATETDIAKRVARALRAASNVPVTVQAQISAHNVTLTGQVDWEYQRRAAERTVQRLRDVYSVTDHMTLAPRPAPRGAEAESGISAALARNALIDAKEIHVTMVGDRAILTGRVPSWTAKVQAGNAAWASPHVADVDNRLIVEAH